MREAVPNAPKACHCSHDHHNCEAGLEDRLLLLVGSCVLHFLSRRAKTRIAIEELGVQSISRFVPRDLLLFGVSVSQIQDHFKATLMREIDWFSPVCVGTSGRRYFQWHARCVHRRLGHLHQSDGTEWSNLEYARSNNLERHAQEQCIFPGYTVVEKRIYLDKS